jgi:DNA helicase-2/ATP-dependent DNA helicase PcrA
MQLDIENNILSNLNEMQRQAVLHREGPALVLAGAGSGKTSVLTRRIALLINNNVAPENILALTFTNKAATEMQERVVKMLGDDLGNRLKLTTFHAFGATFLRKIHDIFGRSSNFLIYDDDDQVKLMRESFNRLNLPFSKSAARYIMDMIATCKDLGLNPCENVNGVIEFDGNKYSSNLITLEYEEGLKRADSFDFGDLLLCPLIALRDTPDLLTAMQQRFKWVLVDEFQDTNVCQFELLQLLCPIQSNIFVVGDDDQSIYSWRGAQVRNMLDFDKTYPNVKKYKLEQNYRSSGKILDASNELISKNIHRHAKSLWTNDCPGDNLKLHRAYGEHDEATYVIDQIKKVNKAGTPYKDIAILYRNNSLSSVIEDTLVHNGIPYNVLKGFNFFERSEVKDVIAYIRILVNPNDDIAFKRAIAIPSRGVGETTIKLLTEDRYTNGGHIFDAIQRCIEKNLIKGKAKNSLADFKTAFLCPEMWNATSLKDQIQILLDKVGYMDYLNTLEDGEDSDRKENVLQLISSIGHYQEKHQDASWIGYLEDVKLVYENPRDTKLAGDYGLDAVNISTIHGVKGLEFSVVFIIGSDDEIFFSREKKEMEIEEERRLYYVAITRAKKQVYITCTEKRNIYGSFARMSICRFVEEIPCTRISVDF